MHWSSRMQTGGQVHATTQIGAASPKKRFHGEEKPGYQRVDQLAVDECRPELLKEPPLQQLVDGFYCDQCGAGFVTSSIAQATN